MRYAFKPFEASFGLNCNKPSYGFRINISSEDYCAGSYGLYLYINIRIYYSLGVCIKPFGELKYKP